MSIYIFTWEERRCGAVRGMRRRRSSELASRGKKTLTFARNNTATYVLSFRGEKKKKLCVFLKRFAGLFCDPGTRVTRKEFGSELSMTPTLVLGQIAVSFLTRVWDTYACSQRVTQQLNHSWKNEYVLSRLLQWHLNHWRYNTLSFHE